MSTNYMVDLLLEELDQELNQDDSFESFLESMNVNMILREDSNNNNNNDQNNNNQNNNNNNNNQNNNNNNQNNNDQNNNNQNNNQNNNGTSFKDKAKGMMDKAKEGTEDMLDKFMEKFHNLGTKVDGFVNKQIESATKGLESLNKKINENQTVKSIEDLSVAAIDTLRVPKLVIRAGSDLRYVADGFGNWTNSVFGGLKKQGKDLKNNAIKGFKLAKQSKANKDNSKNGELKGILGVCNSILQGLKTSVKSLGGAFASVWKTIKGAFNSDSKNESTDFLTLDEEIDYLLS